MLDPAKSKDEKITKDIINVKRQRDKPKLPSKYWTKAALQIATENNVNIKRCPYSHGIDLIFKAVFFLQLFDIVSLIALCFSPNNPNPLITCMPCKYSKT